MHTVAIEGDGKVPMYTSDNLRVLGVLGNTMVESNPDLWECVAASVKCRMLFDKVAMDERLVRLRAPRAAHIQRGASAATLWRPSVAWESRGELCCSTGGNDPARGAARRRYSKRALIYNKDTW